MDQVGIFGRIHLLFTIDILCYSCYSIVIIFNIPDWIKFYSKRISEHFFLTTYRVSISFQSNRNYQFITVWRFYFLGDSISENFQGSGDRVMVTDPLKCTRRSSFMTSYFCLFCRFIAWIFQLFRIYDKFP